MLGVSIGAAVGMQSTEPPSSMLYEQYHPIKPQLQSDPQIGPVWKATFTELLGDHIDLEKYKQEFEANTTNRANALKYGCGIFQYLVEQIQEFHDRYKGNCPQDETEKFLTQVLTPAAKEFRQIAQKTQALNNYPYGFCAANIEEQVRLFMDPSRKHWVKRKWESMSWIMELSARQLYNMYREQQGSIPMHLYNSEH
jgi:hypothetical protein